MKYLTAEEILVIHALIIEETRGSHGVRDIGLLASLTERPKAKFGGKEQYDEATKYGLTLGIPEYQLDFSPHIQQWQR